MKKPLQSVTADLAGLAQGLPTQRSPAMPLVQPTPRMEAVGQVNITMRLALRRKLIRLASERDMTVRAFVLSALRDAGLTEVTEADLADLRKGPGR